MGDHDYFYSHLFSRLPIHQLAVLCTSSLSTPASPLLLASCSCSWAIVPRSRSVVPDESDVSHDLSEIFSGNVSGCESNSDAEFDSRDSDDDDDPSDDSFDYEGQLPAEHTTWPKQIAWMFASFDRSDTATMPRKS
ncbi:hypothetical protein BBP40_007619 [Aspergillus hancockii]|nr:hypothetical protein BBP40_007619 [Aspergillus hancockii]